MTTITLKQAAQLLQDKKDGRFFTVTFVKRSTGERRVMNCRKGVVKFLRGGELPYDASEKNLVTVFDVPKRDYRSINLDTVKGIRADKEVYVVG